MRSLLLLLATLFTVSCSGVPRGWEAAKQSQAQDGISGAWAGTWKSSVNGHTGGLLAVVTPVNGSTWHFNYRASWARILSAGFPMNATLRPERKGGYAVMGSHDLGPVFGGVFTCQGTMHRGVFRAQYHSKMDRGAMEMNRVSGSPPGGS